MGRIQINGMDATGRSGVGVVQSPSLGDTPPSRSQSQDNDDSPAPANICTANLQLNI